MARDIVFGARAHGGFFPLKVFSMARYSTPKSGGTSKFRMVVIDAELQEGEIGQLVQAIHGAFGVQRSAVARLNGPAVNPSPSADPIELPAEPDGVEATGDAGIAPVPAARGRSKAPKKVRTPSLDLELHPEVEPSFRAYADARNVTAQTSVLTKFLIVAAWLDEERSGTKITADRAFTCFRFMNWPFNIDFYQPLRDLRAKSQFLELKAEDKGKGEFTITHLGLNKATEMRVAS
jgi:hypothetical protein